MDSISLMLMSYFFLFLVNTMPAISLLSSCVILIVFKASVTDGNSGFKTTRTSSHASKADIDSLPKPAALSMIIQS